MSTVNLYFRAVLNDFKNAFQRQNHAHVQLIIINVVVFLSMVLLYVLLKASKNFDGYIWLSKQVAIWPSISGFITKPWTILTYGFVHSLEDIWHIVFNMIALYWFGKLFVEYLGSDKLVATYLLGSIAGGALFLLIFNTIPYFVEQRQILEQNPLFIGMVGASAAIYAVMVATATLLPDYTFFLLFLGPVRIKYIAMFFIVVSFLGSVQGNPGGNIAHLGGALIGFIYIKQLQAGVNWGGWITATLDWFKGLFTSKPKVKVTYRKNEPVAKASGGAGKASQDEIDKILDKISDKGYESLSKDEKEKLFNASKK
jgi:membrane associated rhomboid family serine protease